MRKHRDDDHMEDAPYFTLQIQFLGEVQMESVLVLHWPSENSMWLLLNNSHVTIKEEDLMDIAELQDTWLIKIFLNVFEMVFSVWQK